MNRSTLLAALAASSITAATLAAETVTVYTFSFDYSQNHPSAPGGLPDDPTIAIGDTVRWVHVNGFHNIHSVDGSPEQFESPNLFTAGTFFEHTFTSPGIHHYFCTFHGADGGDGTALGMAGTVTVNPAAPACPADIGSTGGQPGADGVLDNNDFIAFIAYFFNSNPIADRGTTGGLPGTDGVYDNNDFIVFIAQFFSGCT